MPGNFSWKREAAWHEVSGKIRVVPIMREPGEGGETLQGCSISSTTPNILGVHVKNVPRREFKELPSFP